MSAAVSQQVCGACGRTFSETEPRLRCECGGLLELRHPPPNRTGAELRAVFDTRRGERRGPLASGVWRFAEIVLPTAGADVLTYPEGNTPLLSRPPVSEWSGAAEL